MRKALLIVFLIVLPLLLVGCVSMVLPQVSGRMNGDVARPPVLANGEELADWEAGREALMVQFMDTVYGDPLPMEPVHILEHDVIDAQAFGGAGQIEQYRLDMFGRETHLVTILPNGRDGPVPLIVMQMFCGNRAALGGRDDIAQPLSPYAPDCDGGWMSGIITMIFGEFIMTPPVETILERGYALAIIYPGDVVPDNSSGAREALSAIAADRDTAAIIAWANVYSAVMDVTDADPRFDADRTAVWGHSRNGKSALLAAALDPRVDLVISHQAGTGGTTLNRSHAGESIEQITETYPHWFNARYAQYAGDEDTMPVDQHQLIALMAPRPLFIGGAWRDQWSDPQGSYLAALGANPVYALYGSDGLSQDGLGEFDPTADIAVFMRPGLHGVTGRDWDAFLAFLDAHFMDE